MISWWNDTTPIDVFEKKKRFFKSYFKVSLNDHFCFERQFQHNSVPRALTKGISLIQMILLFHLVHWNEINQVSTKEVNCTTCRSLPSVFLVHRNLWLIVSFDWRLVFMASSSTSRRSWRFRRRRPMSTSCSPTSTCRQSFHYSRCR
jgi:hypothetical protein